MRLCIIDDGDYICSMRRLFQHSLRGDISSIRGKLCLWDFIPWHCQYWFDRHTGLKLNTIAYRTCHHSSATSLKAMFSTPHCALLVIILERCHVFRQIKCSERSSSCWWHTTHIFFKDMCVAVCVFYVWSLPLTALERAHSPNG